MFYEGVSKGLKPQNAVFFLFYYFNPLRHTTKRGSLKCSKVALSVLDVSSYLCVSLDLDLEIHTLYIFV
jgi:hypothetical protein